MQRLRTMLAMAVLVATAGVAMAETAVVRGVASWRERVALPPGTVLEVQLLDVSRADAPAEQLAAATVQVRRLGPVPFVLAYDPAGIDPKHSYAVAARLVSEGRTMFRSDSAHAVLTRGAGNTADIQLVPVDEPAAAEGAPDPAALLATWTVEEIDGQPGHEGIVSDITLGPDGTASGRGGCNSFSGHYRVEAGVLAIGPLAATRRACLPPLMEQEARFFAALDAARDYRIEDGRLELLDAEGTLLARLQRQS